MKRIMFNDKYGLTEAVLSGNKTQTRRNFNLKFYTGVKSNPDNIKEIFPDKIYKSNDIWYYVFYGKKYKIPKKYLPKYEIGEIVAISQSYGTLDKNSLPDNIDETNKGWKNKMFTAPAFMPHSIRITDIKAERIADISEDDCFAEGIRKYTKDENVFKYDLADGYEMDSWQKMSRTPLKAYEKLIGKLSGKEYWKRNPYVWVYTFELVK